MPLSGNLLGDPILMTTGWSGLDSTWLPGSHRDPNGRPFAGILTENTANAGHAVYQTYNKAASAIAYVLKVRMKQGVGTRNGGILLLDGAFTSGFNYGINLSTGAVTTAMSTFGTFASGSADPVRRLGGGWFEVTVRFTSSTNASFFVEFKTHSGTTTDFLGDGASSILVWGPEMRLA